MPVSCASYADLNLPSTYFLNEQYKRTIHAWETCEGRCNHQDFFNCRCDSVCQDFGDCCIDYDDSVCAGSSNSIMISPEYYECKSALSSLGESVYLVSRCPESWNNGFIESRCVDLSFSMHVYDQLGVNFFNVFCALCHNRTIEDITPWRTKSTTPFASCDKPKISTSVDGMSFGSQLRRCKIAIDSCLRNYANETIEAMCDKYYFPFCIRATKKGKRILYKNPFCAECNGNEFLSTCNGITETSKSAAVMWQFRPKTSEHESQSQPCSLGEIQDPKDPTTCLPISCVSGYVLHDRKCIPSTKSTTKSILQNWKCFDEHVLVVFKSDLTSLSCIQSQIHQEMFFDDSMPEVNGQDNEDGDIWLSIQFTTNDSFRVSRNIEQLTAEPREKCEISNSELLISCSQQYMHSHNCTGTWFTSTPSSFVTVSNSMNKNIFLKDGIYIISAFVIYQVKYEERQMLEMLLVCGQTMTLEVPDCQLIRLSIDDYNIGNQSALIVRNTTVIAREKYVTDWDGQVLVCADALPGDEDSQKVVKSFFDSYLDAVSFVVSCFSIMGLLGTIITYLRFKRLRNTYGKGVLALSTSLLIAQVTTIMSDKVFWSVSFCTYIAIVTHYFWLTSFTWSTVLAFILLWQFVVDPTGKSVEELEFRVGSHALGWGIPMAIVSITLAFHVCDCVTSGVYGGQGFCWIQDQNINLFVFGVPIAVSILTNGIIIAVAIYSLRSSRQKSNVMQSKEKSEGKWKDVVLFAKVSNHLR